MHPINVFSAQKGIADKTCEPSSSGRVTVGDIKMYYQVHGQGEPLLMIMGLGGTLLIGNGPCPKDCQSTTK